LALDHALGQEEAGDQLLVVARGPHGDGEALAAQADLERLLDGELVFLGDRGLIPEAHHRVRHGGGALRDLQLELGLGYRESHVGRSFVCLGIYAARRIQVNLGTSGGARRGCCVASEGGRSTSPGRPSGGGAAGYLEVSLKGLEEERRSRNSRKLPKSLAVDP